jgi:carbamoyl-phosphate synthase large subunit
MDEVGLPMPRGGFARSWDEARRSSKQPVIPPSFVLPLRSAEQVAALLTTRKSLKKLCAQVCAASPMHEVLIEESILGWKEFELEVMRDLADNVVIICSIENFDPMGVHTGDSITVAPRRH